MVEESKFGKMDQCMKGIGKIIIFGVSADLSTLKGEFI